MEYFAIFLIVILFIWVLTLSSTVSKLKRDLEFLEKKEKSDISGVHNLINHLQSVESQGTQTGAAQEVEKTPVPSSNARSETQSAEPTYENKPYPVSTTAPVATPALQQGSIAEKGEAIAIKKNPSASSLKWSAFEKQLIENWTGILGSVILTAGLSFLGVLSALALTPFFRFLMLLAAATAVGALSYYLARLDNWKKFAFWLRGISGAVALFACFASAAIPGIQWVESQSLGLVLIGAGVALNLFFAYTASRQIFASIHLFLSLVTLAVLPQQMPVYALASFVALAGVVFSYKSFWIHQTLLSTLSYVTYQVYRYFILTGSGYVFTDVDRYAGIGATLAVTLSAISMHYIKTDIRNSSSQNYRVHLVSHLMHWFTAAIGLAFYATGERYVTLILFLTALLTYALARVAKKKSILWLYRTDLMVAQSIALYGIVTLYRWEMDVFWIACMINVEALLFLRLALFEKDPVIEVFARPIHLLSGVAVLFSAIAAIDHDNTRLMVTNGAVLIILVYFTIFINRSRSMVNFESNGRLQEILNFFRGKGKLDLIELFTGFFLILVHILLLSLYQSSLMIALIQISLILLFIYDRKKVHTESTSGYGLMLFIVVSHLTLWLYVSPTGINPPMMQLLAFMLPFFVSTLLISVFPVLNLKEPILRLPGIGLFSIHLLLFIFFVTMHFSPLLPGVVWLMVSLIGLEIAYGIMKKGSRPYVDAGKIVLYFALFFIAAFLIHHVVVELQTEFYILGMPLRMLIQLFSISVFAYWLFSHPRVQENLEGPLWGSVQPLFLESIIAMTVVLLEFQFTQKWMTLFFALFAMGAMALGQFWKRSYPNLSRMKLYGVFMYYVAAFHIAFLSTVTEMPANHFMEQSWVIGLIVEMLLTGIVVWFYRSIRLEEAVYPGVLSFLRKIAGLLTIKRNHWVFDPLFIASALFLYWSFDHAILTLLWVVMIFIVFGLSIVIREGHFRILALMALAFALARLIFFDLSQSSLTMRAIVFVGVGILMLGMNSLYNRFKGRFV